MTLTLPLRHEAEAEAARLRAARGRTPVSSGVTPGDIPVTALRTSMNPGLDGPGVVFFVRAGIIDTAGRLLEYLIVTVGVPLPNLSHHRRRRDVRSHAQHLCDRAAPAVLAIAREQIARRAAAIRSEYGRGLERALRREEQLATIVNRDASSLVQAGLFDGRALKDQEAARLRRSRASVESVSRAEALRAGPLAVSAAQPEIALLLILYSRACRSCCLA